MLRKAFITTFTAAALACSASPTVKPQKMVDGVVNIQPDEQQSLVCREVVSLIENYNYKKVAINDSISSVIFNNYLKSLDPTRSYFLDSDIKEFEKARYELDDDFRNGDLTLPFYMFNVYLKRYTNRIDFSLAKIKAKYDFSQNDSYTYDREKMPWMTSSAAMDDLWSKRVKYELVSLKVTGTDPAKNVETLTKRYQNLKSQSAKLNNQDVFQLVMDAFTEAIDPHTNYFNPRNAESFNVEMSRSLEGIGATLQSENELTKIVSLVPGGPAFKSKQLNAGDRILAVAQGVNGEFEDVAGWRLDNVVVKIKGPKGTVVRLKIIPAGKELSSKPVVITLTREKVILADQSALKKVKTLSVDGKTYKIGVISVPAFYADFKAMQSGDPNYKSTTRDVKLLIDTLKNRDKVDAILMDLRANGGGSLVEAIDLTGLFIDKGPVVQVKDARGRIEVDEDKTQGVAWDGPFAVMVDRLSASASEIFSGAIQDYGRGVVIGTQTYGKGTVQSTIDLNKVLDPNVISRLAALFQKKNGAAVKTEKKDAGSGLDKNGNPLLGQINLTIAKFYRVSGNSTQHKGVMPDITFPSVYPMDKIGEDTEPSALPFDVIQQSQFKKVADLNALLPTLNKLHNERMAKSLDYKFLQEDVAESKKKSAETSVTLNEAKLKAEREAVETKNFARKNELRVAKGLAPIKKGEKTPKEEAMDFIQDESLRVLVDFINQSQNGKLTSIMPHGQF